FTFVEDARKHGAKVSPLVLGDARLTLARNPLQGDDRYGVLVVDAFSSDAIPIHLITKEALEMFKDKVRDDGIILFHISNRYLNLKPVLANLAKATGMAAYVMDGGEDKPSGRWASTWVVLANK